MRHEPQKDQWDRRTRRNAPHRDRRTLAPLPVIGARSGHRFLRSDTRGARGRAPRRQGRRTRAGAAISEAVLAGLPPVHLHQIELFSDDIICEVGSG